MLTTDNHISVECDGFFKISWTPGDGTQIAGYRIYRSPDGANFSLIGSVGPAVTSYSDTTTASVYFYRITSFDATGSESAPSGITGMAHHTLQATAFRQVVAKKAVVGDFNGDGKPDIALADKDACIGKNCGGKIGIYLTGITTRKGVPNLTLGAEKTKDGFGQAVAVADLNKDGYDDLVVGAPYYDPYISSGMLTGTAVSGGKVYVYLGAPTISTTPSLTKEGYFSFANNGSSYYMLRSEELGYSLASAGDINGDGYPDVAIGLTGGGMDLSGAIRVLYGGPALGAIGNPLRSPVPGDLMGSALAPAGDVNGDGYPDVVIEAPNYLDPSYSKKSYLMLGGPGLSLAGSIPGGIENYGAAITGLDFNGDRFSDLALNPYTGNSFSLFYGSALPDATADRTFSGLSVVSSLGDMDKDGHGDLLIVGPKVIFGTANPWDYSVMSCPMTLTVIGTGDFDKDGVTDIIGTDTSSTYICSTASFNGLPQIIVNNPAYDDSKTSFSQMTLSGRVNGSITKLFVAGKEVSPDLEGNFQASVTLVSGPNIIEILAVTLEGKLAKKAMTVTYATPPALTVSITSPLDGAVLNTSPVTITGTVSDPTATVTINGNLVPFSGAGFQADVSLSEGLNTVTAAATDSFSQTSTQSISVTLLSKGTVSGILTDSATGTPLSSVNVSLTDAHSTFITSTDAQGRYSIAGVSQGNVSISFTKQCYVPQTFTGNLTAGQTLTFSAQLVTAPALVLSVNSPADGITVYGSPLAVSGAVNNEAQVTVNGLPATVTGGEFSASVQLTSGLNTITVNAADRYNQTSSRTLSVTYVIPALLLNISAPTDSITVFSSTLTVSGTVNNDAQVSVNGVPATVAGGEYSASVQLTSGLNSLTVNAVDRYNQTSSRTLSVTYVPFGINDVAASSLNIDSAVIGWGTSHPATSLVEYGETTSYGSSVTDGTMATTHSMALTGLKPATLYHYRVSSTNAYGSVILSEDTTFITPAFTAKTVGDFGNVTVMEVNGNYDAKNPDNTTNSIPRQEIAKEYFKNHPDQDFLVMFTTFDYAMSNAGMNGFYQGVKNDTLGIGMPLSDKTTLFGSSGKLQGTIDLGNITAFAAAPYGPKLEETLSILGHEFMHRFGAYVKFRNVDGTTSTALLGSDSSHWSYLLDSKGSVMYGNGWADNGDGTFTSRSASSGYSPLDLYLMGMIPKEQVGPMLLIDNPAIDVSQLPQLGATVNGTAKTVTIDDIIAVEGERVPNASSSPKQFSFGYVLLIRQGDTTSTAVSAMEILRAAFAGRLAESTLGLGSVDSVPPALNIFIESPTEGATVTGEDVTVSGVFINSTGADTGVTVNGIVATVSGNRFIANHVPLQAGENAITITATDDNGLTVTATRTVTTTSGHNIRITSNIDSGLAPLDITLRLEGTFDIVDYTYNVSGPMVPAIVQGTRPMEFNASLKVEGTYTITVNAVGPDGQTYSDSIIITVVPRLSLEALLKAKWEGMKKKVISGDYLGAGAYFPLATRDMFVAVFNDPTMAAASRLNEILELQIYTVTNDSAQGGAIRQEPDGKYAYPVNFIRDENGIWRIRGF